MATIELDSKGLIISGAENLDKMLNNLENMKIADKVGMGQGCGIGCADAFAKLNKQINTVNTNKIIRK